jgi:hypothetical protein
MTAYQEADGQWKNHSTIPIDEDGEAYWEKDMLADYWEEAMLADTLCPDTSILQINPETDEDAYINGVLPSDAGDYLNIFEEYRGFNCRGIHTRTNPWRKDFFVYSDLDTFNIGLGCSDQIGPNLAHLIDSTEMKNFFIPNIYHYDPNDESRKSINWLADRIESHNTNPCIIVLNNRTWTASDTMKPLGVSGHASNTNYVIPKTTTCSYIYTRRIQYHTPPNFDPINLDLPADTNCWKVITGHEVGHDVNFGESTDTTSIMDEYLRNYVNPPSQYKQADLDSFLVKPQN